MTKYIEISDDKKKNNISVYTKESAVVITADRSDLENLRKLSEANQAGIYLLIGEDIRYIGQASSSVYNRLSLHDQNKSWWKQVIFFGREDGHLDKSQTDYLEQLLIKNFKEQTNFKLDNQTKGNNSYINQFNKIKADSLWKLVQEILVDFAKINLFADQKKINHKITRDNSPEKEWIIIDKKTGQKITGRSPKNVFDNFFKYCYYRKEYQQQILSLRINGKPTISKLFGTKESITTSSGQVRSVKLADDVYFYTDMKTEVRKKKLLELAQKFGTELEINF